MSDSEKWKKFDKVETLIWFREMAGVSVRQSPWSGLEPGQCESSLNSSQRKVMLLNYKHETREIFHLRRQPSQYLPWVMIGQPQPNSLFKLKMWTQRRILALAGPFISIHHDCGPGEVEKNDQFSLQTSSRRRQALITMQGGETLRISPNYPCKNNDNIGKRNIHYYDEYSI